MCVLSIYVSVYISIMLALHSSSRFSSCTSIHCPLANILRHAVPCFSVTAFPLSPPRLPGPLQAAAPTPVRRAPTPTPEAGAPPPVRPAQQEGALRRRGVPRARQHAPGPDAVGDGGGGGVSVSRPADS